MEIHSKPPKAAERMVNGHRDHVQKDFRTRCVKKFRFFLQHIKTHALRVYQRYSGWQLRKACYTPTQLGVSMRECFDLHVCVEGITGQHVGHHLRPKIFGRDPEGPS